MNGTISTNYQFFETLLYTYIKLLNVLRTHNIYEYQSVNPSQWLD